MRRRALFEETIKRPTAHSTPMTRVAGIVSVLFLTVAFAGCVDQGAVVVDATIPGVLNISRVIAYRDVNGTIERLPPPSEPAWATLHAVGVPTTEPSIAVTSDGSIFVIAGGDVMRSQDDGATWEMVQSYAVVRERTVTYPVGGWNPGIPFSLDPWIWADRITDRVYVDHLTLACTTVAWSDDVGESWSPAWAGACGSPLADFQKLVTGPPGPEPNVKAGMLHASVAYLCYNKPVFDITGTVPAGRYGLACAASYDGGLVWENEKMLSQVVVVAGDPVAGDCAGGAWIPAVAPDGTVVIRSQGWGGDHCLFRTRDSGATWERIGTGADFGGSHLAFDDAGTLYAMSPWWQTGLRISVSHDQGETWEAPFTVQPPGVYAPMLANFVAGDAGKLFIAFWGTSDEMETAYDGQDDTRWHAWLVAIEGADTDSPMSVAYRATPDEAPMHIGPGGADTRSGVWLGDFITATIGPDGTPYVVFPATCNEGCAGNPDATRADLKKLGTVVALRGWSARTPSATTAADTRGS